jgi:hypothetical protein
MEAIKNFVKTVTYWIVRCIICACDAAIPIWLLHELHIIDIPLIFIFYYGIITGTIAVLLRAAGKALDRYMKKNEED